MSFVITNESPDRVTYIDPEQITGYSIERDMTTFRISLHVGARNYTLTHPDVDVVWSDTDQAQRYVEDWLIAIMAGVERLKQKREELEQVGFREPQLGDIYRILDNYWEIITREPGSDKGVSRCVARIVLEFSNAEKTIGSFRGHKYTGGKTMNRKFPWWEEHAELVGHREMFEEARTQLLGEGVDTDIVFLLDGLTGREQLTVHSGVIGRFGGINGTLCCKKPLPLPYGHVISTIDENVTCGDFTTDASFDTSEYKVVHYAKARDNKPQCCDISYPLPAGNTWSDSIENVTCSSPRLEHFWCDSTYDHVPHVYRLANPHTANLRAVRCDGWPNPHNVEGTPEPESKPCGSTKGHGSHTWQEWEDSQEGPLWSCTGLTFPDMSAVDSSGDQEA